MNPRAVNMDGTAKKANLRDNMPKPEEADVESSALFLDRQETAAYIADVVLQLRNMAKRADLKFLAYFLEMAFQEAFTQSTRPCEKKAD